MARLALQHANTQLAVCLMLAWLFESSLQLLLQVNCVRLLALRPVISPRVIY